MNVKLKLIYITSVLFFKRTTQKSWQSDCYLHFNNESRSSNFPDLNETMGKIKNDAYEYSYTAVVVFGILGNILVILSILKQKNTLLRKNYYFLVLHLAICDLAALIKFTFLILLTLFGSKNHFLTIPP